MLPVASLVVIAAALCLPIASLLHGCYDGWRLARADDRLPDTSAAAVRAVWRWFETLAALAFVAAGFLAVWTATLPRGGSDGVAPLPGWAGAVLAVPLAVAGALAALVLLRVTVTVWRRR